MCEMPPGPVSHKNCKHAFSRFSVEFRACQQEDLTSLPAFQSALELHPPRIACCIGLRAHLAMITVP